MKKRIIFATILFLLFASTITLIRINNKQAAVTVNPEDVNLYFFYGDGCPHCAKEEIFLDDLELEFSEIKVHRFETWYNDENAKILDELRREVGFRSGVPVVIIGEEAIVGYGGGESTGERIRNLVSKYIDSGCNDIVGPHLYQNTDVLECEHGCNIDNKECEHDCGCSHQITASEVNANEEEGFAETVELPFIGVVSARDVALPVFTILVAAADGFNPCAMWVLLFLINLLIGMKDKLRMWILGTAFIVASAFVYYIFVFTWLQIFLLVGFIIWVRVLVATIAFGSGAFHLQEYWDNREGGCVVEKSDKRKKIFNKIRKVIIEKKFLLALGGIILLAGAVNLVELICSAGFPQAYVGVLALADLPTWQYHAYILLYIFIFMIDDLLIFIIAMTTLKLKAINSKYTHWSFLVGGVLMLIISFLLILKPEWLSMG